MQLIKGQNRNASVLRNVFGEVRELGVRLEQLISRYERLVREVEDATAAGAAEMEARIRMANRELSVVAVQLQQLIVEEFEAQHAPGRLKDVSAVPFSLLRDVASA